jgi:glycosyltransferase involved in cell wall biosynthesis
MGESDSKNTSRKSITAIVITKNEESMIANCLASLRCADEVIVVDSGSTDNTLGIANREGAMIVEVSEGSFATWREAGLHAAHSDWVFYVDADERVTPKLATEITDTIQFTSNAAFALARNNIHFGKWLEHGGWETDKIVRLFRRTALKSWSGEVHESAQVDGILGELKEPLVHLTHRNIKDGLVKSAVWTDIEARLLFDARTKPVKPFTLVRKFLMEFIRRLVIKKGYKDGMEGWIESFQQAINRFFVYERLWELQQKPSVEERYQAIEKEIVRQWEKKK